MFLKPLLKCLVLQHINFSFLNQAFVTDSTNSGFFLVLQWGVVVFFYSNLFVCFEEP